MTQNSWNSTVPVDVAKGGTGQSSYTDGQLLIGNTTGNTLTKASLTAGTGISITPGSGSITITNTGGAGLIGLTQNASPYSTFLGYLSGNGSVSGTANVAMGYLALSSITSGIDNIAIGAGALNLLDIGSDNIALGNGALGVLVNATPGDCALNIAIGIASLGSLTDGASNISIGYSSAYSLTTGDLNTVVGHNSLPIFTTGDRNAVFGSNALASATSSSNNSVLGDSVLGSLLTGTDNISIGYSSGSQYFSNESNNILLGSPGATGDSNVIRIGNAYSPSAACYISGIYGSTVTGSSVLVDSNGQLGDVVSSIKVKENVQDIAGKSSALMQLRPVSFNYKADKEKHLCFGMIAEEVKPIFPELVLYKDGVPYGLKYHEMPALLLNEIQKMAKRIDELERKLAAKG